MAGMLSEFPTRVRWVGDRPLSGQKRVPDAIKETDFIRQESSRS